ncbi:unnamed protein product [Lepeophtheirus salmonis]|uniref:(salmon louse) hypothetical protein n=1 Tax=Lepeophtheirus salmonis TaxID=72036 RepID=A0A7R8H6I2_LEPSM|nr:unnamed protein product [Lepeophtheirus salmonis]CAF2897606.1 unnamed protein product [Lepeophtheirus salmonis]
MGDLRLLLSSIDLKVCDSLSRSPIDDPVKGDNSTDSITLYRSNEVKLLQTSKEDDLICKVTDASRFGDWSNVEERAVSQESTVSPPSQFNSFIPYTEYERVHIDYAKVNGQDLLILLHSRPKWIEASYMSNTSTNSTLNHIFKWFSYFGFTNILHSDNGPQFTCDAFRSKLMEWGGGAHTLSSTYHPQSNGQALYIERIDLKESRHTLFLLSYRSRPLIGGKLPGELLFARPLPTTLYCRLLP